MMSTLNHEVQHCHERRLDAWLKAFIASPSQIHSCAIAKKSSRTPSPTKADRWDRWGACEERLAISWVKNGAALVKPSITPAWSPLRSLSPRWLSTFFIGAAETENTPQTGFTPRRILAKV